MTFLLGRPLDFYTTLQIGFFPFIVFDLLKAGRFASRLPHSLAPFLFLIDES